MVSILMVETAESTYSYILLGTPCFPVTKLSTCSVLSSLTFAEITKAVDNWNHSHLWVTELSLEFTNLPRSKPELGFESRCQGCEPLHYTGFLVQTGVGCVSYHLLKTVMFCN